MLSGTSPFKDASEWLIFQRIIAREIRFPDYFSDEARDLIDRLLVSTLLMDTIIQIYHP
jgi:3-phosphoinositide dependent protein kinase-1